MGTRRDVYPAPLPSLIAYTVYSLQLRSLLWIFFGGVGWVLSAVPRIQLVSCLSHPDTRRLGEDFITTGPVEVFPGSVST